VLSAQIIILWSWTLLTWWWLRWLPSHFPPDLSKSSVVVPRICAFGKHIACTPMAMSYNYLASCGVFNSYIGCARCEIYKSELLA
jgi:hypothetical protein